MKKSLSTPNLSSMGASHGGSQRIAPAIPSNLKRSVSTNAFPMMSLVDTIELVSHELQAESVMHITTAQASTCSLLYKRFPHDILLASEQHPDDKEFVECLVEPDGIKDGSRNFKHPRHISGLPAASPSYLDLCADDDRINERYAMLLRRVRRASKK